MDRILKICIEKCRHCPAGKRVIRRFDACRNVLDIFNDVHGPIDDTSVLKVTTEKDSYEIESDLKVCELVAFNVNELIFNCRETVPTVHIVDSQTAAPTQKNAFVILIAGGTRRAFPDAKKNSAGLNDGLSRKDELYNELLSDMRKRNLDFSRQTAEIEGSYCLQILINALWYITNQHNSINDASLRFRDALPVPPPFGEYTGYNDVKRKKVKSHPLSSPQLGAHANTLYSLLMKPYFNSSPEWKSAAEEIQQLADCFLGYKKYLDKKAREEADNRSQDHPVRTVDQHATVEHRKRTPFAVNGKFLLLDKAVNDAGPDNPVVFDENKHCGGFENNVQRFRFFKDLQLSVPVDMVRFCPGGSVLTTVCITQVKPKRTDNEMLTQASRMVQRMRPKLQEFHTRAQKMAFKHKLDNIAGIQPAVVDFIYKELTLDAATTSHPHMQQRLNIIFLGDSGLLSDLRHLNPGRPTGTFDDFFQKLCELVEDVTAADDRRHGTAHLARWISLSDMIKEAASRCPDGTAIPSKSLVRLQFAPTNPYTRAALSFTSRIQVQYKIQKRQLRVSHPDAHYCAAFLKYLKSMAVDLRENGAVLFCCDDKAKISVGEPGQAVSTGVRGRHKEMSSKHPGLKGKWVESIEPVQSSIRNRFLRLKLKDRPISAQDPATDEEIDLLQRHLKDLFPDLDLSKLQKAHTKKVKSYNAWKEKHCRETNYCFQIRKCEDEACCLPPKLPREKLTWLPEPTLDESGEHYKPYDVVKGEETTENQPSLTLKKTPKTPSKRSTMVTPCPNTSALRTPTDAPGTQEAHRVEQHDPEATAEHDPEDVTEIPPDSIRTDGDATPSVSQMGQDLAEENPPGSIRTDADATPSVSQMGQDLAEEEVQYNMSFSAQNARAVALCIECRKPRVVYSNSRLGNRRQVLLATALSNYEYTCGAFLFPPSTSTSIRQDVAVKPNLLCSTPMEIPFYNSATNLGRKDMCAHCGIEDAITDPELKKMYKTVLPICDECRQDGKTPIVQRPYGKKGKTKEKTA